MNFRNPKYCRDGIRINCEIEHPEHGWIPFTCDPEDKGAAFDTAELHERMVRSGDVARMTQAEIDAETAAEVRFHRNQLLAFTVDPLATNQLRWAAMSEEQQQALASYRQALLDLPDQPGFPHDIEWPLPPEGVTGQAAQVALQEGEIS